MRLLIFGILVNLAQPVWATLPIPGNMSPADMGKALQILGYGSASKILGDPYPLGGYSGWEFGISTENFPTDKIATLGNGTATQSQINYYIITLGKGIYDNLDTFLQFAPMGQLENISNIGGQVRWGFYQAEYLPIYLSAIVHGDSTNFENVIVTNTMGIDLLVGFKEGDVTLYFGGGPIRAMGTFSGGNGGITNTGQTISNGIQDSRVIAGLNIKINKFFLAGEIDNYTSSVYAAKLGARF